MNRNLKESTLIGGRNVPMTASLPRRRGGLSLSNGNSKDSHSPPPVVEDTMDLFSRTRRSLSVASSDESSDLSVKLGRLSVGSAKQSRNGVDDLLSSNEGGKHDYDWLLTPPGTPLFPSSDGKEPQPTLVAPRSNSLGRPVSTNKTSRLSVSQSESSHPSRPARSSSVTRPSISTTQYSSFSNKFTSILNTSSASVSSYIRPSTPTSRSSTTRPSTPTSRSTPSRASTPSRTRPSPPATSLDKARPSPNSRPSSPSSRSRPQTPANLASSTVRPASRPSTPTRRSLTPSLSPSTASSTSAGRASSNGRNVGPSSRPSSPSPRIRPPPQPMIIPDFPLETPPNLRTTLPDRPLSAGRSRPGAALTVKGNVETSSPANATRRQSSPIVTRGRLTEPAGRVRPNSNTHVVEGLDSRKGPHVSESLTRKPIKSSTSEGSSGFGRTISKKSLDMAIKHMDIRNGSIRPLSGSTLFPQSIRSTNAKIHPGRISSAPGSVDGSHGNDSENGHYNNGYDGNRVAEGKSPYSPKLAVDIYESSRYDAILLKEDLKNTNWLHSADDSSDQGPLFDHGFEHLPEPFSPL